MAWKCPQCGEVNSADYMLRCICGYEVDAAIKRPKETLCPGCLEPNPVDQYFCKKCGLNLKPWADLQSEKHTTSPVLALKFNGSAREYFRIWIVNLCLILLTVGIFSAWAKVRKKRYFYSHTTLDGTPFEYLGQPIPILKGRVIAVIVFSAYYMSSHFFTEILPYILLVGAVLAPWIIIRSAAFNARYSSFRNMTFRFDGKYLDALKATFAYVFILVLLIGLIFKWPPANAAIGVTFGIFGLLFPWWIKRLKNFIICNTSYGGQKGEFSATTGQFFKVYLSAGLLLIPFGIIASVLGAVIFWRFKESQLLILGTTALLYIGYVLAYAYVKAHGNNLVWNHSRLGGLRFESTLQARGMAKLYLTNALAIIASLGLMIPWAVIRTLKYRADNLKVQLEGNLSDFRGCDRSTVRAVGEELGDFFDVDLSL
jgi:uncharacterized membrane protein YjgN (DUF898 family)